MILFLLSFLGILSVWSDIEEFCTKMKPNLDNLRTTQMYNQSVSAQRELLTLGGQLDIRNPLTGEVTFTTLGAPGCQGITKFYSDNLE